MINVTKTFFPPIEEYNAQVQRIWENQWLTNRGALVLELEEKLSALKKLTSTHSPIVVHANNQGSHRFISGMFLPDVLEVTWARTNSYTFHSDWNQDIRNLLSPNSPDLPSIWIDWIDGKPK